MKRIPVRSSLATSIGYDHEKSILEIEFKASGAVWQYEGVPENNYQVLMKSTSIGSYFRTNIKGQFPEKMMENSNGIYHSMKMVPVDSTTINAVGYDAEKQKLRIIFSKNDVYDYKKVPEKVFKELLKAESKGTFFNLRVKEKFLYYRL